MARSPATKAARALLIIATAIALIIVGGGMMFVVGLLVPLLVWAARTTDKMLARAGWYVLADLALVEGFWELTYAPLHGDGCTRPSYTGSRKR